MKHFFLSLALAFLLPLTALAQTISADDELNAVLSYMKTAMRYSMLRPQEKVYLHLDNTAYFKGEKIWLKGYVTRTDDGAPTDLSHILYVELLNPQGDVVESRKLPIVNGMAHGDISMDSIITTGFYELRAFTRYMTNWGTNACFSRVIPIFKAPKREGDYSNPELDIISHRKRLNNERQTEAATGQDNVVSIVDTDDKSASAAKPKEAAVRFYPEGGDIVSGLPTRVAFTLVDNDGLPTAGAQCTIADKSGAHIATTTTDSDGRGIFALTAAHTTQQLRLVTPDGKRHDLPDAKTYGATLSLDLMRSDMLTLDIHTTPQMHGHMLGYAMVNNGRVVRADTLTATASATRTFDRAKLPKGVSQITLFNADGRILAERMFFICPDIDHSERITATSPTSRLKPCGKVRFDITAQPNANLSFSAIDANGLVNGMSGNIHTWMLLSSELRGYIAHPEHYFEADDEAHRRDADLLMLTQGWRRYDWSVMSGTATMSAPWQPIEDQQYLFGRLRQKSKKNTVENVWLDAKLFNMQGQVVEGKTRTDSMGNYTFILPEIEGEWNLSVNTGKADKDGFWEDKNYYIAIDRHFSPTGRYISPLEARATPVDTKRLFKWTFTEEEEQWVSMTHKNHVLKNVTVKAKGRVWDRTNWSNESNARKQSLIYYNCDTYSDRIADQGEPQPAFTEWLKQVNSLFSGETYPIDDLTAQPDTETIGTAGDLYNLEPGTDTDTTDGLMHFYRDGLSYKNRPIVWILDNQFQTITSFRGRQQITILLCDRVTNAAQFPDLLDEVKSVYISEDLEAMHTHFMCEEVESTSPIILYCYTHRSFPFSKKGMRNTRYQGYNIPSTFQMEDYTSLPPVEDLRRTLYWQPELRTDANGHATIEFWNNSSCREIQLSIEGMTDTGKPLAY